MKRINENIRFACLAALAIGLAACSQDELSSPTGGVEGAGAPVTFTATGIAMPQVETRATVDGTWDDALSVAIKIGSEVKEYTATPNDADSKTASLAAAEGVMPFYWRYGTETKDVQAWYPYKDGETSMPAEVVVEENQSIEANYLASDLLSASGQVSYGNTALTFEHRTAKITLKLQAAPGSTVSLEKSQVLLYNLSTANGKPTNIYCYRASDDGNTHHALVAPQTFDANKEFLKLILADGAVHNYVPAASIEFEAGYQYVFTITLTDTGMKVTVGEAIPWGEEVSSENGIEVIETDDYICYGANGQRHYYVKTEAGLKVWAEYVSAGNLSTNCTLMNDINLTPNEDGSSNWPQIIRGYTGTFDGAGHQVDYVTMKTETGNAHNLGFITRLTGTVKNLTIGENSTFVAPDGEATGSVVGELSEGGRIINCHSYASVTGHRYIGGIVGRIGYNIDEAGNLVVGCSFSGTISYDSGSYVYDKYVGGIVGFSYCSQTNDVGYNILNTLHVVGCYNTGSINITSERRNDCIGGIAGSLTAYDYGKLVYVGCYSTDALSSAGTTGKVGALVGQNNSRGSSLSACYWSNYLGEGLGTGTSALEESNIGLVDNETINWTTATENMNAAIKEWNAAHDNLCPYHYEQINGTDNPPTLVDGMP